MILVQDFEGSVSVRTWPRDAAGKAEVSTAWSADGARSLRVDPGVMGAFRDLAVTDWTGYAVLRFQAHNPGPRTAGLGVEIQDDHEDLRDRHEHAFGLLPGDHALEIDISGGLWRGEEDRPYRGAVKTPIDVARVTRLGFTNRGDGPVFIDRIELVKAPPIAAPGAFAFDFGPTGKQVMGQTLGVFETTLYDAARGYGMVGGEPEATRRPMSYPTPLLGDGLAWNRGGFRVDLPGGAYLGWIAFERGGFMEGEQCGYAHADVLVNGAVVTGHDFSPAGPHFLFEDTEVADPARIEDDLVRPAHAPARFSFTAAKGENLFTLAVASPGAHPLRVAGLFLAPDTPEGRAYLDAQERRQHDAVLLAYPPEDRGRRGPRRSPPARDLVVEPMAPGAQMYPRDFPVRPGGSLPGEILAVAGQTATLQLGVYAARDLAVHAGAAPLAGPAGATLPGPTVLHGRYLPTRPLGGGPVWIEVDHDRPGSDFRVGPDLARPVIFEWRVPRGAPAGAYAGSVRLAAGGALADVPVRVRVVAVDLPEIPIPVALFMNALPFGPEAVGEARFWELTEALLDEQARAGLNAVTGGPGLMIRLRRRDGAISFSGDAALRFLDLARARGMARAAVAYGGFWNPLGGTRWGDPAAFAAAWTAFAADRKLPPMYFDAYDEPATPDELDAATSVAGAFTRAGLFTMGFLTRRGGDARRERLIAATYAPALHGHDLDDLRELSRRGQHPWVYSSGLDRRSLGLDLFRDLRVGRRGAARVDRRDHAGLRLRQPRRPRALGERVGGARPARPDAHAPLARRARGAARSARPPRAREGRPRGGSGARPLAAHPGGRRSRGVVRRGARRRAPGDAGPDRAPRALTGGATPASATAAASARRRGRGRRAPRGRRSRSPRRPPPRTRSRRRLDLGRRRAAARARARGRARCWSSSSTTSGLGAELGRERLRAFFPGVPCSSWHVEVAGVLVVVVEALPLDDAVVRRPRCASVEPAVARADDDLELVVAVDVADRGRRDDPLPGELRPALGLAAAAVEGVDEVAARAGDDLGVVVAVEVGDRLAVEEGEVLEHHRRGGEHRARLAAPHREQVVAPEADAALRPGG